MKKSILTAAALATLIGITSLGAQACDGTCSCGAKTCGAQTTNEKKAENTPPPMEYCYGIAKAGKNDCHGPGHSCAGLAKKDGDKEEYIMMPAGLCEKLVGGSLKKG